MRDMTPEKAQALLDDDDGSIIALDEDKDAYLLPSGQPNNLLALPACDDDGSVLNPLQWSNMIARFNAAPDLARAYIAQAVELTRLRNAVDDVVCGRGMFGVDAAVDLDWAVKHLSAALATYQQAKEGGE